MFASGPTPADRPDPGSVSCREAALGATGRGWSVVPVHTPAAGGCSCGRPDCPSPGKHPRIKWETSMAEAAPLEQIGRWWRRWPAANLGIVTGRVSGIAVLDIDPRNGGEQSLAAALSGHGPLPVTPEVRTGGGGRHLWFSLPPGPVPSALLAPGLDLKAEGGMIVAPPSLHVSGRRYAWANDFDAVALAPLPGWIADRAASSPARRSGHGDERPPRTRREQEEFAAAWGRAGVHLSGGDGYYLCPFHPDHHPSLHVDAAGCRWYCFGCRRGGGIGRLLDELGEGHRPPARSRRRGRTGRARPVTLAGGTPVEVVGESHHQDELLELSGGGRRFGGVELEATAELVPDPFNRFDPQAVEVRIDDLAVGHIRRDDLEWVRPLVDESLDLHGLATCRAVIRGGWDRGGEVGRFGVVLYLP